MTMMEKVTRVVTLYDFYGALLTERQRDMVELYFFDDWSLAEIAEHHQISRQAVHDNLKRAVDQLSAYEDALQFVQSHEERRHATQVVMEVWATVRSRLPVEDAQKLDDALQGFMRIDDEEAQLC